ncbi:MAG: MoaD/ThiS family protein [Actinomycetota bacterium]|jgi:sulfur-carrier protein
MAVVTLRAPLKDLAGGNRDLEIAGGTVGDVLRELESTWPKTTGWILDEHGAVRRHVNVFRNGERVDETTALANDDHLQVLPSITGGT